MDKVEKEPEVTFMDEEIGKRWGRHSPGRVIWGFTLLFVGLVFLLNTLGVLPWEAWSSIYKLWPLILVLVGLRIILGDSLISRLAVAVLVFCLFSLIFLALVKNSFPELISPLPESIRVLINIFSGIM